MAKDLSCCMTIAYMITWWCAHAAPLSKIMTVAVMAPA